MVTRLRSGSLAIMHQSHVICTQSITNHPPVKQYTTTHHNTCSLFFIPTTKVSGARAALWIVFSNVYRILASVLIRVRPLKFLYLHSSPAPPCTSPSLRCILSPPVRFLPSLFPSFRPCLVPFLPHSFHSSTLHPFLHSRYHPPSHHRFLTPSPHSPSSLLPPILHPSSLFACLPPCLPVCLPPSNSM